ncbi:MAG TPA: hypothetical protein VL961_00890 [Acidimicrobiales bacterium]|nr:hypothetical protein [Acidimicrobiales bacterium]
MVTRGLPAAAAALAAVLAFGVGAATASAATPQSLSEIQQKAATAVAVRVNDLNDAIGKVGSATSLGSEAGTLDSYLQADIAPLQSLGQQIAADTSATTAAQYAATIFSSYRVLALVLPAAHLAGDAATVLNGTIPALNRDLTTLSGRVTSSSSATVEPLISAAQGSLSAASTASSGVESSVLTYTPPDWNTNHSVLAPAANAMKRAHGSVLAARNDIRQIRTDLGIGRVAAVTTTT